MHYLNIGPLGWSVIGTVILIPIAMLSASGHHGDLCKRQGADPDREHKNADSSTLPIG
jgi:hypothetical protein